MESRTSESTGAAAAKRAFSLCGLYVHGHGGVCLYLTRSATYHLSPIVQTRIKARMIHRWAVDVIVFSPSRLYVSFACYLPDTSDGYSPPLLLPGVYGNVAL